MNGWFLWYILVNVGKYTSPMDGMDMFWFGVIFATDESVYDLKHVEDLVKLNTTNKNESVSSPCTVVWSCSIFGNKDDIEVS